MNNEKVKGGFNMDTQKSETITIRKDTLWKYSTFILLGVVILGAVFYVLPGKSATGNVVQQPGQQLPTGPTQAIEVETDGAAMKGEAGADVTMVKFTDIECPFCQRHEQQSEPAIAPYIASGKVKQYIMHYPLPFHPQAQPAAEAVECARDQGGDAAFFEMYDILFTSGVAGGETAFKEYAQQIGLNANEFATCMSSDKFVEKIQANMAYGSSIGIQGTPGFFINGKIISGACPANTFTQAFDAELNGDDWAAPNCQFVKF